MSNDGFKCLKCNKRFNRKDNLSRHLNRTTACELITGDPSKKIKKEQCEYCLRTLSTPYAVTRHYQSCKVKNNPRCHQLIAEKIEEVKVHDVSDEMERLRQENKETKEQMEQLIEKMETMNKMQ